MLQRNTCLCTLLLITILATLYATQLYKFDAKSQTSWAATPRYSSANDTIDRSKAFHALNLTYPLRYSCRQILARETAGLTRASLTKTDSPLFDQFQIIDSIQKQSERVEQCLEPVLLHVPVTVKGPPDASHLAFGIQTTMERLEASVSQLTRWLGNTGAKLFVVVIESETVAAKVDQISALESRMREVGLDVNILQARKGDTFPQRYFSLVSTLYNNRTPATQWVSLIDDDTFFPSMPALLSMLAKYDTAEMYYIGSLSEDWWAVSHYGYMGFGGAGLFLSIKLAEAMEPHTKECETNLRSTAGDITLMDCIYTYTDTKLTHIPELHQVDMRGELSGFFESGRRFLSLHHWKDGSAYGAGYPMELMHKVADVCGECFLQRWQFGDDMILTNGFSIAVYPKGHLKDDQEHSIDPNKMEETWSNEMEAMHSLGPTRPKLKPEEKIQYRLIDSIHVEGGVRQFYWHKGQDGDVDTLLELFWQKETTD
ncbi:MAG: hypothetical protein MMC33_004356 [Icmadophila ericetorum]|nr:hypothetical protein [Icmadophila ericetorum]